MRSELTCGEGDGGGERECRLRLLVWLVKADPLVGYLRSVPICAPVSRHRWSGLEFFGRCAALPCFVVLLAHRRVGASNSIRWPITIFSYFFLEEIDWSRQVEEKGVRWPLAKEKIVKSIKVLPNLELFGCFGGHAAAFRSEVRHLSTIQWRRVAPETTKSEGRRHTLSYANEAE